MNSHERPQDPRFTKSVAETRKKYHDTEDFLCGKTVNRHVLGSPLKWSRFHALQTRATKDSAGPLKQESVEKIPCTCNEAISVNSQHSVAYMLLKAK